MSAFLKHTAQHHLKESMVRFWMQLCVRSDFVLASRPQDVQTLRLRSKGNGNKRGSKPRGRAVLPGKRQHSMNLIVTTTIPLYWLHAVSNACQDGQGRGFYISYIRVREHGPDKKEIDHPNHVERPPYTLDM